MLEPTTVSDLQLEGATASIVARRRRHPDLWVLRRLGLGVVTLFAVSIVVFLATQGLPGDPARAVLGPQATAEQVAALRHQLGLDRSLLSQYGHWIGQILTGNLGDSLTARESVSAYIGPRLVNTAILVIAAAIIALPLSYILGALAALRRDRAFDHAFVFASLLIVAVPEFVVGLVLIMLFATTVLKVVPAVALISPGDSPIHHLNMLVLPVATLALAVIPYLGRLVRASMIEVLDSDYIELARLKGMPTRIVLWVHALPNAMVPALQATALTLAWLTAGIVVIEYLFRYPGLGSALTDAVNNRDVPVIQAIMLIFAAAYVLFNLIADILTVYLTPRLRTAGR